MNSEMIKKLSFVKSSRHRTSIMLYISDSIKMPSQIAENIDIRVTHVSKYLNDLKDKNLVVCLNEEDKRGRLYQLTDDGKELLGYLP
ncbi:MAG: winged helix-turn-helix domain-containing protein [Methanobacteriaceae archaeon]